MSAKQQEVLETQLRKMLLLEKAYKIEKSVKRNHITIKEIVKEVKKARNEK